MKKLILMLVLTTFTLSAQEPIDTDGNGYRNISTLEQLRWVSENDSSWSWNFELDNDIDASDTKNWNNGEGWSPIGNSEKFFQGIFEGNGFEIDSIYINRPSQSKVGFFGYIVRAEIRKVGVINCDIKGENVVGGLVGSNYDFSIVSNSYSTGSVEGTDYIGGLAGYNYPNSLVIRSYSLCNVIGHTNVGGFIGANSASTVSNSYSTGSVSGTEQVGGLVGGNSNSTVSNSYSTGNVFGTEQVGGLVGYNQKSTVAGSFWNTQTSGQTTSAGGTGKTTEEMKTKSTFTSAGWNFDFIWDISTAYPVIDIDTSYRPNDTDADGYLNISTLTDLRWLSESGFDLDSDFELDNDINAADTKNWNGTLGFSPIGINFIKNFLGEFEGHGYKIHNLYINRPNQSYVGFFGIIEEAEIRNVGVVNCDIKGENVVGGLVGSNYDFSIVSNSYSTGSVKGNYYVGGLVGHNITSTVSNGYSTGSVSGTEQVGGLVGGNSNSTVSNSYSTGSIFGKEQVGGLVGYNQKSIVAGSFWNTQTSVQTTSAGGTGKSTAEMKTKSTFTDAGWDFEYIWSIDGITNDGYPFLQMLDSIPSSVEAFIEKNENSINIYPNPASEYIEISLDGADIQGGHHLNIEIYDVLGEFVSNVSTSVPSGHLRQRRTIRVDVSTLTKGVYFVRIGNNVEKFVKM